MNITKLVSIKKDSLKEVMIEKFNLELESVKKFIKENWEQSVIKSVEKMELYTKKILVGRIEYDHKEVIISLNGSSVLIHRVSNELGVSLKEELNNIFNEISENHKDWKFRFYGNSEQSHFELILMEDGGDKSFKSLYHTSLEKICYID